MRVVKDTGFGGREPRARRVSLSTVFCLVVTACVLSSPVIAQEIVDRTVATVYGGTRTDLITYSDLLWQTALQPDTPVPPRPEDLNRALQLIIDQHLILQEADRLPTIAPSDEEIQKERDDLVKHFPSEPEFRQRLEHVGLSSDQLREIIRQRVAINKYLDFRFRSFTVVTQKEVADYYRDVFIPRLKRESPGRIVPTLEQAKGQIEKTLTESKIESETDAFLDTARENAEIITLWTPS
jgi:hypothetical protein